MKAATACHIGGQWCAVVRRLLELGADHTPVGTGWWCEGKTALELAGAEDKEEAAAVLREWACRQRLAFAGGSLTCARNRSTTYAI